MREEIDQLISEQLDEVTPTLDDIYHQENVSNVIADFVTEQNKKVQDEDSYKQQLLATIRKINEYGLEIPYQEDMSIEELEDIIQDVNF